MMAAIDRSMCNMMDQDDEDADEDASICFCRLPPLLVWRDDRLASILGRDVEEPF